jgi:hypothetical protein
VNYKILQEDMEQHDKTFVNNIRCLLWDVNLVPSKSNDVTYARISLEGKHGAVTWLGQLLQPALQYTHTQGLCVCVCSLWTVLCLNLHVIL